MTGQIVSLQVGLPRTLTTVAGRSWTSAITKAPVDGTVSLGTENLAGDQQANRKYHGGPSKALCVYCAEHYPGWCAEFGLDLPFGAFGENLTTVGLTEENICIGDVFALGEGDVRVQVSQPRQPCANISKRWAKPALPRRMEETGRTGIYLRVLQTGDVAAGDVIMLVERPHPGWTAQRANSLMYAPDAAPAEIAALCNLSALSAEWKRILGRKLALGEAGD